MTTPNSGARWLITAILVAVAAGGGFFLGNLRVRGLEAEREAMRTIASSVQDLADERQAELEATEARRKEDVATLEARNQELVADAESLRAQLAAARLDAAPAAAGPGSGDAPMLEESSEGGRLAVDFGRLSELEQLTGADWPGMAEAVETMSSLIEQLYTAILAGEQPSQEDQIAIAKENQRLVAFALEIIGKLPTHAPANGEYAHPIALANLTAAVLDRAGEPLSESQRAALARLGEDYQQAWDRSEAGYGPDAPAVTKLADELALKRDFMQGARHELTEAQLARLTPESIVDRNRLDVLSPVVMTIASGRVLEGSTPEALRESYVQRVRQGYGLSDEELAGLDFVFDTWTGDIQGILAPTSAAGAQFYDLDEAVVSAQAHAQVVASILASPGLDEESRNRMLSESGFVIPRLVE